MHSRFTLHVALQPIKRIQKKKNKIEELETVGELFKVCSQVVLKCLYLARLGRLDVLWSVNKLARAVTKMDSSL